MVKQPTDRSSRPAAGIRGLKLCLDSLSRKAIDLGVPVVSMLIGAASESLANEIADRAGGLGHAAPKPGPGSKHRPDANLGPAADALMSKTTRIPGRGFGKPTR